MHKNAHNYYYKNEHSYYTDSKYYVLHSRTISLFNYYLASTHNAKK